jgi:5-methylcytosine-specific restriction endonuclease McrA
MRWEHVCGRCGAQFIHDGPRKSRSRFCYECRVKAKAEYLKTYHAGPYRERGRLNIARHRQEKPEHTRARDKRYRLKAGEKRLEATRRWRQANRERVREYQTRWIANNRDRKAAHDRKRRARRAGVEHVPYGGLAGVFERDGGHCAYCGWQVYLDVAALDHSKATVDHVAPLSFGGPDVSWNVVLACRLCNNRKQAQPLEAHMARYEGRELESA